MKVYFNTVKRLSRVFVISTILYSFILAFSIFNINSTSMIYFPIQPYVYGSERVDLFFPLIISLSFSWYIFFEKKNDFLFCVSMRTNIKHFLRMQLLAIMTMCFFMIFIANLSNVVFSVRIATIETSTMANDLRGHIGADLQMNAPILFGILWSAYKALIGTLICFMSLTFALYIRNFFLVILLPFCIVFLENFITGVFSISEYSFTTSFVLNRLSPEAMAVGNQLVGIGVFLAISLLSFYILRSRSAKY